ncbi:hypothetical protein FY034_07200 [Trichlorobacter lovleyi]|uniref:hypothetical protein n=1 Tax=Trichlorobacter lovleyi TaxID=313985 RepID=UPI00223ED351|nr:hypothetical protein [Trichlorobacter lovleyi]QOX78722.1 hypothetical protein FY034_07200 [Trichlorobacter lovleyi]
MSIPNIFLNAIELPGLVVSGDVSAGAIRATVKNTLNGGVVVWEEPVAGGSLIDLKGGVDFGWLTRSTLLSLVALANVAGTTATLTLSNGTTKAVRFRNEDGAIEATPLIERPNPADTDYYNNVIIRLMEV